MNIDQRLHRAAHDLREIEIDVPPLALGSTTKTRTPLGGLGAPVAAAMLFVFGAVMTVGDIAPASTAVGQVTVDEGEDTQAGGRELVTTTGDASPQLSAREELAMISARSQRSSNSGRTVAVDSLIPPGAS